jgi:hypothetical protein
MAVVLAGCAQKVWTKPGLTQAEFNRDQYMCEKDARQSGYFGGGIAGAIAMQEFQNKCMVANGYTLISKENSTPLRNASMTSR